MAAFPISTKFFDATGLDPSMEKTSSDLIKINLHIKNLAAKEYKACKVYVIFDSEHSQRKCLESMSVATFSAMADDKNTMKGENVLEGNVMKVDEAPEPETIFYENLQYGLWIQIAEQVLAWAIIVIGLIIAYFSIRVCFNRGQPALGAVLISVWNIILPEFVRISVTKLEHHHTTDSVENAYLAKTVAVRGFISTFILYLVGREHASQLLSSYFIGSIQAVLLADALTSPVLRLLDLGGNFNRHVLAPMAISDERAKSLMIGADYFLVSRLKNNQIRTMSRANLITDYFSQRQAARYTDLSKSLFMSLFFSALFPLGYFYTFASIVINFWVDKSVIYPYMHVPLSCASP